MRSPSKSPITAPSAIAKALARNTTKGSDSAGFTLVEMLVAMAILLLILALVLSITDQTSKVWKSSTAQIQGFQSARAAYDTMTERLRQATLNTYLDYYDSSYNSRATSTEALFVPAYYARNSDLAFTVDQAANFFSGTPTLHPTHAVFFQAPLGFTTSTGSYGSLQTLMNACGYFVEFNTDKPTFPAFVTSMTDVPERYRYRLMEFLQPSEANTIYSIPYVQPASAYDEWFLNFLPTTAALVNAPAANAPYRALAENIIALVISPELTPSDQSIAPSYSYDSRAGNLTNAAHHQLPPLLRVVMVAIDEPSAIRLNPTGVTSPPSFLTTLFTGAGALFQTPYSPAYSGTPVSNPAPNKLDSDLSTLTQTLVTHHVNYRIYDTDIGIRGAKWSTQ